MGDQQVKRVNTVTFCGSLPKGWSGSEKNCLQVRLEGSVNFYFLIPKEFEEVYSKIKQGGGVCRIEWEGAMYSPVLDNGRCVGKIYAWKTISDKDIENSKVGVRFTEGKLRLQDIHPSVIQMLGEVMTENPGLRIDLIPKSLWVELGKIYTFGLKKYSERNWEKGLSWMSTFGCALRHIYRWRRGKIYDDECKVKHLAQGIWNLAALLEFEETHPELDDRPKETLDLVQKGKERK